MYQTLDSLLYFAVLGLLCGVVSFRLGWRIGGRVALPLTQTLLGFVAFAASWRAGGSIAAAVAVGGWAAGTSLVGVGAFAREGERAARTVVGASTLRNATFKWLAHEEGPRSGSGATLARGVRVLASFSIAATASAGALAIGIAALLLNAHNATVAALLSAARRPWVVRGLAWNAWSVARVIALAALGTAFSAPLVSRLGYPPNPANIRGLLAVGGAAALADIVLELTLSKAYRRRLASAVNLDGPDADRGDDVGAVPADAETIAAKQQRPPTSRTEGSSMRGTSVGLILACVGAIGAGRVAAAADSAFGDTLLIANKSDHTVDLYDPSAGSSRATLETGRAPHEIAVSPDGRLAVISNYGPRGEPGSSLTVLDVAKAQSLRTIPLGEHHRPHGMVWYRKNRLAVTTEGSKHLLVVHPRKGKILKAVETGQDISHMVAVTPDGKRAFVANIGSGSVTAIDLVRGVKLLDIVTGDGAEGIALTPNGKEVWVGNRGSDTLSVIDPQTLEIVAEIPCPGVPIRVAVTPDGRRVLVSCARTGEVALFDTATRRELARKTLDLSAVPDAATRLFGDRFGDSPVPVGLVISRDGATAWVAATQSDVVVVIDTNTLDVKNLIRAGREPDGMGLASREVR